ncbi:MAG: transposase [Methylococcaceae bacterium]
MDSRDVDALVVPILDKEQILIMDTPVHRAKSVQNHFDKNYIKYLYIPSYSPELNSIKDVLSKIKQLIKKQKARMPGDILNSLKKSFFYHYRG